MEPTAGEAGSCGRGHTAIDCPPITSGAHQPISPLNAARLSSCLQVDDTEWQRLASADLSSAASTSGLALPERWVVSALHRTVKDITEAHER